MIFFNVIQALTWYSDNLWLLVLTWLSVFGVYILFFVFSSSGRNAKPISQLPSITNSYWTLLSVPLKLASLKPNGECLQVAYIFLIIIFHVFFFSTNRVTQYLKYNNFRRANELKEIKTHSYLSRN